jgi:hypothetical protein
LIGALCEMRSIARLPCFENENDCLVSFADVGDDHESVRSNRRIWLEVADSYSWMVQSKKNGETPALLSTRHLDSLVLYCLTLTMRNTCWSVFLSTVIGL